MERVKFSQTHSKLTIYFVQYGLGQNPLRGKPRVKRAFIIINENITTGSTYLSFVDFLIDLTG